MNKMDKCIMKNKYHIYCVLHIRDLNFILFFFFIIERGINQELEAEVWFWHFYWV